MVSELSENDCCAAGHIPALSSYPATFGMEELAEFRHRRGDFGQGAVSKWGNNAGHEFETSETIYS